MMVVIAAPVVQHEDMTKRLSRCCSPIQFGNIAVDLSGTIVNVYGIQLFPRKWPSEAMMA
jgi:hypothetical protein